MPCEVNFTQACDSGLVPHIHLLYNSDLAFSPCFYPKQLSVLHESFWSIRLKGIIPVVHLYSLLGLSLLDFND